jgi:hypothetical protein
VIHRALRLTSLEKNTNAAYQFTDVAYYFASRIYGSATHGVKKMKKFVVAAALIAAFAAAPVAAETASASVPVKVTVSQPLFDSHGKRIGNVYRVAADGSPQLIIDEGRLVTVPATTLSEANGKLTTSLTKRDVTSRR